MNLLITYFQSLNKLFMKSCILTYKTVYVQISQESKM